MVNGCTDTSSCFVFIPMPLCVCVQAGEKLKAMKALLRSGDKEKIVFFAGEQATRTCASRVVLMRQQATCMSEKDWQAAQHWGQGEDCVELHLCSGRRSSSALGYLNVCL